MLFFLFFWIAHPILTKDRPVCRDYKPATLEDSNSGNVSLWTKKRKRDAKDALLNQINHINTLKKHATTFAFFNPKDNVRVSLSLPLLLFSLYVYDECHLN